MLKVNTLSGFGRRLPAAAGSFVTWTDGVNVSIVGNDVTKNAGGGDWNAGAFSVEGLAGNGRLTYTLNYAPNGTGTDGCFIGLSVVNADATNATIDFAWAYATSTWRIYEDNAFIADYNAVAQNDVLEIIRTSTTLDYQLNGVSKRTRAVSATDVLKADISIFGQGVLISGVKLIA